MGIDCPQLEDKGLIEFMKETLSGTTWWRCTRAGLLAAAAIAHDRLRRARGLPRRATAAPSGKTIADLLRVKNLSNFDTNELEFVILYLQDIIDLLLPMGERYSITVADLSRLINVYIQEMAGRHALLGARDELR